jgi:hypothetical protein
MSIVVSARADDRPSELDQRGLQFDEILRLASEAQARGNELSALGVLRKLQSQYWEQVPTRAGIGEASCHLEAVVGNYREALHQFSLAHGVKRPALSSEEEVSLRNLRPKSALEVLDPLVEGMQIVMVNEAHHVPQHRAFTIDLLRLLQKKGFRYFAVEALSESDPALQERGYPINTSGYYTAEPVFGDLIRTAIRLGFRIVPYEAIKPKNPEEREQGEAQNLVERVFGRDPRAKVLVYAGYDHINESEVLAGVMPLAMRLHQLTGLDPLTIDQTVMTEWPSAETENATYRYLTERWRIAQPTIFVDAQHQPWTVKVGLRDITLFHARSRYMDGRPTWLALGGVRKRYKLPQDVCGAADRCLLKARFAQESAEAIPVDELEVIKDKAAPALMLPKGEFMVEVQDTSGKVLATRRIRQR